MRILFYFNWEFSQLCHALAIKLKEGYGVKDSDMSGLAIQKKDYEFLKNQKDVAYSHLGLMSEYMNPKKALREPVDYEYLRRMEKKYGMPNLWPLIYADRDLVIYNQYTTYSHEDCMKFLQSALRYTESLLEKTKPDVIIYDCIASMPAYVFYKIAEASGIKNIIPTSARIGNRVTFSYDTYEGFNKAIEAYDKAEIHEKSKKEAREFLREFGARNIKPEYAVLGESGIKRYFSIVNQLGKIPKIFEYVNKYNSEYYSDDYFYYKRSAEKVVVEKLKQNVRRLSINKSGLFEKPDYSEDYAFFPLHFEPETATMVMAPMYLNQVALAENIAKSLPVNYKLYIKDHPAMALMGMRRHDYYWQLRRIPNVKLINPMIDSKEIIRKSGLVFAITGTAGWEAAMLKKPVITFGKVFFNRLRGVRKCEDINKLPEIVKEVLEKCPIREEEVIDFVAAIWQHSFEIKLGEIYGQADPVPFEKVMAHNDLPLLVRKLAEEIGLQKSNSNM